ncbi:putative amidoligase enzyme-domain-containing protein [Echria macrotheca]|uniref:Amidoligase enzyme-domain-containing protein n=1 Tax=Echria macrotheca TaxID=438768 RepID=A0AAJ0BEC7_9PEZI|nr:putative amidoligase enzyme-domain-containing protein [Echria macrotheca]
MADYSFGVEIEVCAEPHTIRPPLITRHALYYEKLAASLRKRHLPAKANDLRSTRRSPDNYDAWWITRDGSIANSDPSRFLPFEAVSPILTLRGGWEANIDTFWESFGKVFHLPKRDASCGSHIHISRGRNKRFTLSQLKTVAFGIVMYEDLVKALLTAERQNNRFCRPNTEGSAQLRRCRTAAAAADLIKSVTTPSGLRDVMQDSRYVLWNFDNVLEGRSGTIEFRGGRFLRGVVRTKRWIAFAVAFIHAILTMDDLKSPNYTSLESWTPQGLYKTIRSAAGQLGIRKYLPEDHMVMSERAHWV